MCMTTKAKKDQLIIYMAEAKDKKVNELYTLLEADLKDSSFTLTEEHLNILNERQEEYESGKAIPQPWEEVHDRIKNKKRNAL